MSGKRHKTQKLEATAKTTFIPNFLATACKLWEKEWNNGITTQSSLLPTYITFSFSQIRSFLPLLHLCPMGFKSMHSFTWRSNGAAESTFLTWVTEAITGKLNSSQSHFLLIVGYLLPNGLGGVKNTLLVAAWGPLGSDGTLLPSRPDNSPVCIQSWLPCRYFDTSH